MQRTTHPIDQSDAGSFASDVDPDTAQAVEDVLDHVLELRVATTIAAAAANGSPYDLNKHHRADARVQELTDLIASRARSVHATLDDVLRLANERIAADRRLPRYSDARVGARKALELVRARDDRHAETNAAREALRAARSEVARCEHRERVAVEALRIANFGPSFRSAN